MRPAIIYTRFSPRPNAAESMSCEFQEQKCREYCSLKDWDVLHVYEDRGKSGKNTRRPGLEGAIAHCLNAQGVLVVYNLSRFSRSLKDILNACDLLARNQCELVLVADNIDTSTPAGKLTFHVMGAIAQFMRETTAEHTKAVLSQKWLKGEAVNQNPAFGWEIDPRRKGHVRRCKHEQETKLIVISLRSQGASLNAICAELTKRGRKSRAGKWYPSLIGRILQADENGQKKRPKGRFQF